MLTRHTEAPFGPALEEFERARQLPVWAVVALVYIALLLGLFLAAWVWSARRTTRETVSQPWRVLFGGLTAFLLIPGLLATLLGTLATRRVRPQGQGMLSTWFANFRSTLPVAIAVNAVLYLGLTYASVAPTANVIRREAAPEMQRLLADIGPSWHNPIIPPDAYRAEYPPEPPTE